MNDKMSERPGIIAHLHSFSNFLILSFATANSRSYCARVFYNEETIRAHKLGVHVCTDCCDLLVFIS